MSDKGKPATIDPLTSFFLPDHVEEEVQRRLCLGEQKDTICLIGLADGQSAFYHGNEQALDDVIAIMAHGIKSIFHKGDLFVRIAPTAFFIYTNGCLKEQDVKWKGTQLLELLHASLPQHFDILKQALHIGVADVEKEQSFSQLLQKVEQRYWQAYQRDRMVEFHEVGHIKNEFPMTIPPFIIHEQDIDMQIVSTVLQMAFQYEDQRVGLDAMLKVICEYYDTQQFYIVEKTDSAYEIMYEWKKCNHLVENENFKRIPLSIGNHFQHAFSTFPLLICSKAEDLLKHDPFIYYRTKIRGAKSLMLNTLNENGTSIGYFCMIDQLQERIWHTREIATFSLLCNILNITVLQLRFLRLHHHLAAYDALTNAWSLKRFVSITEANLKRNFQQNALITLDIKEFKFINSEYGYSYGNQILQAIVNILQLFVEPHEYFARIDGDLFVVLLQYQTIEQLRQRLLELIKNVEHCSIRFDNVIQIKCMIGVYLVDATDLSVSEMIDRANIARKYIKNSHESNLAIYNGELEEIAKKEHYYSQIMHQSLHKQEFVVYYQPKVNIRTHRCVGLEALVRWNHEGQLIQPGEFIPLFEKNHFITELDLYVLERACQQLRVWIDSREIAPIPISVNFSRVDLANAQIVEAIIKVCNRYGIPRNLIEIEVTESAFLENEQNAIDKVKELKAVGFSLSMDDFGTGFSSLSLLRELEMDVLKLDCSFFQKKMSKREEIILINIVHMAMQLQMEVVSEGIETKEHVAFLERIGCEIAQGYYFARPMAQEQLDIQAIFDGSETYEY